MTEPALQLVTKPLVTFAAFYALYPRHIAPRDAEKAWGQIGMANQAKALEALPNHIRAWESSGTEKHFIPYPASWLRGYRWEDEIEIAKPKLVSAWWTSPAGIIAEGAKRGLQARPGETMNEFKGRIESAQ